MRNAAMALWVIYCHSIALPDGTVRRYVGQTNTTMHARWLAHLRSANAVSFGTRNPFHLAISRYGAAVWKHEELEICFSKWDADRAEKKWIKHFRSMEREHGFNIQNGG
jgi:hypothetical protein